MTGQTTKIVLSVLVILGAGGYLLADTLDNPDTLTYFHGADVVIMKPTEFLGQRIRMGGHVEKDSIMQKPGTLEYQFEVKPVDKPGMLKHPEALGKTITVRYTGVVPDTFKDDAEVIVTGKLQPGGELFIGSELLAKCPSKYEAEEKNAGTY
jgi:cytochrome c-type biogenesis protein CcmE